MTYLIAAAGTGGHIFPGLAVAEELVAGGVNRSDVLFVGGDRMEKHVVPDAGFPYLEVELAGLQRRMTTENLKIPKIVMGAVSSIARACRDRSVGAALGLGGYVTVPAGLASRRVGAKFAVSEQNAHAGLANRLMSRLADRSFGSFPETIGMPNAEWIGNPIRSGVLEHVERSDARAAYGIEPGASVLGVFGGSLGAGSLNQAVAENIGRWASDGITVLHLVGERNQDVGQLAESHDNWHVVAFEDHMQRFYSASDLVIARAGGAVAELTATGSPSVLVPGTFGSGGHQEANAQHLADAGAAVAVPESAINSIGSVVIDLIGDPKRLAAMAAACQTLAKPTAAAKIAAALEELHG